MALSKQQLKRQVIISTCAGNGGVACESRLAFANEMTGKVTTLGIVSAQACQRWDLTLVDVCPQRNQ